MLKFMGRKWWVGLILVGVMLILPFSVSAITMPEVLQILAKVIEGVIENVAEGIEGVGKAGRDAYCAAGISAFCPD